MEVSQDNKNKQNWDSFLLANKGSFLQSWEWGAFQESLGKKAWRLAIGEPERIFLQAQIIKERFFFSSKSFLYIPFGPTWQKNLSDDQIREALSLLWKRVGEIAKQENTIFCLAEPLKNPPRVNGFNFQKPTKRIQPEETLIVNLTQPTEQIFNNFNSITRYNIRLAEKKGVQFKEVATTEENMAIFYHLMQKTSQRDEFKAYSKDYFEQLLKKEQHGLETKLFFADYQGKIIAANIMVYFGPRTTHLHGASDYEYRATKAPQFLQWQQVKQAKEAGFTEYDFWGISAKKWPSLTEYKKGFGGQELVYPAGQEIVYQKGWYSLYKLARKLLKR
ncbi:MAG: peptidoglycan bridge formation glycyltransferase FemA/FemB family protein [Candidatus Pacebacteria bacterium]|nr:peptidoglycan bridge formation glycyltransferase FemA/FemB family protein [Candidatus Paceibacterota bacterium]